jgi:hypothetical protein
MGGEPKTRTDVILGLTSKINQWLALFRAVRQTRGPLFGPGYHPCLVMKSTTGLPWASKARSF